MMYANFGEFISKKRVEKKITLRKMADMLGVSAPFLTDVEKDRRNPFDMRRRMEPVCRGTEKAKGVRTYICIDLKLKERDLGHQC